MSKSDKIQTAFWLIIFDIVAGGYALRFVLFIYLICFIISVKFYILKILFYAALAIISNVRVKNFHNSVNFKKVRDSIRYSILEFIVLLISNLTASFVSASFLKFINLEFIKANLEVLLIVVQCSLTLSLALLIFKRNDA